MSGIAWASLVFLALALLLPLAALQDRKLPARRIAAMAGIWVAIFLAAAVLFAAFGG